MRVSLGWQILTIQARDCSRILASRQENPEYPGRLSALASQAAGSQADCQCQTESKKHLDIKMLLGNPN